MDNSFVGVGGAFFIRKIEVREERFEMVSLVREKGREEGEGGRGS